MAPVLEHSVNVTPIQYDSELPYLFHNSYCLVGTHDFDLESLGMDAS
jgi:hypothetical protein